MRLVTRLTVVLLSLLLALAVLAALLYGTLILRPQVVFNDRSLSLLKAIATRWDWPWDWSAATLSLTSDSAMIKTLQVTFQDLRVETETVSVAVERARGDLRVGLWPPRAWLRAIGPIEIAGGTLQLDATLPKEEPETASTWNPRDVLEYLRERELGSISIGLREWRVLRPEGAEASGSLQLALTRPDRDTYILDLRIADVEGLPVREFITEGELRARKQLAGTLNVEADLRESGHLAATVAVDESRNGLDYEMRGDLSQALRQVGVRSRGVVTTTLAEGALELWLNERQGFMQRLTVGPCDYAVRGEDILTLEVDVDLNCKGELRRRQERDTEVLAQVPARVPYALEVRATTAAQDSRRRQQQAKRLNLDSTLTVSGLRNAFATGSAKLNLRGMWDLAAGRRPRHLEANVDASVKVDQFARLVEELKPTAFQVPAPFHLLDGTITCQADARLNLASEGLAMPFSCRSDLQSPSQSVDLEVDGRFGYAQIAGKGHPTLTANVLLTEVRLVLPAIGIGHTLPRLTLDSRIKLPDENKGPKKELPLRYDVTVATARPNALLLNNQLTSEPLPVVLDLKLRSGQPLGGTLAVGPADLELFRRRARIEQIALQFVPDDRGAELNGRVRFAASDYLVFADILGTLAKPRYVLTTDPPLPERDAIAMLIFGRKPELLDESQQRSADETRAALADSAISLASMYYLASTPVESIGYNPQTGLFTAKVTLREGVSLIVGSDAAETNTVGLRRRIGRNWMVETTAISEEGEGNRGVAMLKWARRY